MSKTWRLIFTFSLLVGLIAAIVQVNFPSFRPEGIGRGEAAIIAAIYMVGFAIFLGTERDK